MRFKFYLIVALISVYSFAQTNECGTVLNETFDGTAPLVSNWTEYNTSGRITLDDGRLKFDHNTSRPSAYTTFDPITNNTIFSFDVSASRSSVNCQIHLISSSGKYLSSVAVGVQTASIKHATSITNGIPSGFTDASPVLSFSTNTIYSISSQVNFETKKVSLFNNGSLIVDEIPFLEDAEDIAKIDIQLIYMWSNNGQFYFDNVSLLSDDENRLQLTNNITAAEKSLNNASVGTIFNQYPQTAVDNFQASIETANTVLSNCESTSDTIDNTLAELQSAQDVFDSSRINDPVLKLFAGYNFTGEEYDVTPGYYNGGLESHEDWAVSFTLEKGYMATFAQDINGLGFSKIYIAQDNDLEINLPIDLQRTISFIRVSPWYPVAKKGALGGDPKWSTPEFYNTTWFYNWGLSTSLEDNSEVQFTPMSWSRGDNWTSLQNMENIGKNMNVNNLMAFNEPDNKDQANLTVEQALEAYPKLLASGLRLGAPGVENISYSTTNDSFNEGSWIQEFMDGCIERGYRVDFIPAHDYVRRSRSTFIERFKALHDRYDLPIWVTEYNYGNPNFGSAPLTVEQGYNNIKGLTEVLEESDFIERYNWYYFFGPATGIGGITDGELNITGQFYRDLVSKTPSYNQEVYEQGELSTASLNSTGGLNIFPNPVTDGTININIDKTDITQDLVVKILTSTGKELISLKNVSNKIDVSKLNNGIYLLQLSSSKINSTTKIIINQ